MSSLDFEHDDCSFAHEVELNELTSILMTEEFNDGLDNFLALEENADIIF